ncbi:MAG: nucleoside monophosphate kinase [bacterium]
MGEIKLQTQKTIFMRNITLLGPPGCGKGTQAEMLAKAFGLYHLSTGNIFRDISERNDEFALRIRAVLSRGNFAPDQVTIELVQEALIKNPCDAGYIFDGFPRNISQYKGFKAMFSQADMKYIYFSVSEEELIERLLTRAKLQGRSDDALPVIRHRLSVYDEQTKPIIDHLDKEGRLITVVGTGKTIPEVWAEVKNLL